MIKIAVDAMGGDFAPTSEVEGALEAARDFGVGVLLVGRTDLIQDELDRHRRNRTLGDKLSWRSSQVEIVEAPEVITMNDPVAQAVRRKKNSSIRVAAKLVRDGAAQALVSAGNTGAAMMTSKLVIGSLAKVDRPALATVLPTLTGQGVFEFIMKLLRHEMMASIQTKAGALLTRPAFRQFKKRLDYAEYGGAPLLGIKGVTVICHGRSSPKAIRNAIRVARDYCLGEVNHKIEAQ